MASPAPEVIGAKRKRSPMVDDAVTRSAPITHTRDVTKINYLMKMRTAPFRLIEGDSETFADVLGMLDDYEGVFLLVLEYCQITCVASQCRSCFKFRNQEFCRDLEVPEVIAFACKLISDMIAMSNFRLRHGSLDTTALPCLSSVLSLGNLIVDAILKTNLSRCSPKTREFSCKSRCKACWPTSSQVF